MPSAIRFVLVGLTTLRFRVESRNDHRYDKICTTGHQQRVTVDQDGRVSFGSGDGIGDGFPQDNVTGDIDGNATEYGTKDHEGDGWLRRLADNLDVSYIPSLPEGTATALPWIRQTEQQQENSDLFYDESFDNFTSLPPSRSNDSYGQPPQFLRPCLCHPMHLYQNYYGPNETVPDLYLCPVSAGFCGVPPPGMGPVVCFAMSIEEIVAVNAWPLILLWYLGMLLICCISIHGTTAIGFCRSFFDPLWNRRNVDRILAQNASSGPTSRWNVWARQNYRFEQNLLSQTRMIMRYEDTARNRLRQEQGFPPPSYEMKTKRYSKDHGTSTADDHGDDDDSNHEPSCTICFVPLEDGDLVGDLACQHIFHKACLKSWFTRKNACPLCNTVLAIRRPDPQPQDLRVANSNNDDQA